MWFILFLKGDTDEDKKQSVCQSLSRWKCFRNVRTNNWVWKIILLYIICLCYHLHYCRIHCGTWELLHHQSLSPRLQSVFPHFPPHNQTLPTSTHSSLTPPPPPYPGTSPLYFPQEASVGGFEDSAYSMTSQFFNHQPAPPIMSSRDHFPYHNYHGELSLSLSLHTAHFHLSHIYMHKPKVTLMYTTQHQQHPAAKCQRAISMTVPLHTRPLILTIFLLMPPLSMTTLTMVKSWPIQP